MWIDRGSYANKSKPDAELISSQCELAAEVRAASSLDLTLPLVTVAPEEGPLYSVAIQEIEACCSFASFTKKKKQSPN